MWKNPNYWIFPETWILVINEQESEAVRTICSMIPKLTDAYYDYVVGSNYSETQLQNRNKKEIASVQKDIDNRANITMKSGSNTLVAKLNEKEQKLKAVQLQ